jgi:cytoskeletal protein CcmA (bactofilin family)
MAATPPTTPPASGAPTPAKPPATAAPAKPAPPPPRPKVAEIRDVTSALHDSVDAERWNARGAVKVTGDVHIGTGELEGNASVAGKLVASSLRSHGALDVEGPIEVSGMLSSAGTLHAGQALHAGDANLRGTSRVSGAVSVDRALSVRGHLIAPSIVAGTLSLDGVGEVPGQVTAGSVDLRLSTQSSFGTVVARSVTVHGKVPNLVEKVLGRQLSVTVRRIEADSVHLEGVDVAFVRAPLIHLGRDAHVTEYEGSIVERHSSSRVGFESRSPRPYGLRR